MNRRPPRPESLLRMSACALLAAVATAGLAHTLFRFDLAEWLHWAPDCVFRAWTGLACPGCGMAHALVLLGQLELVAAFAANPAAPLLVLATALTAVRPRWASRFDRDRCALVLVAVLVPLWLNRLGG